MELHAIPLKGCLTQKVQALIFKVAVPKGNRAYSTDLGIKQFSEKKNLKYQKHKLEKISPNHLKITDLTLAFHFNHLWHDKKEKDFTWG